MNLRSSSTFSSETSRPPANRAVWVTIWAVVWLCSADLAINWIFPFPADPKTANPHARGLYFDYGRSSEGKLARMTRRDSAETAPITLSGWYEPLVVQDPKTGTPQTTISFYGMSHTVQLAHALARTSDRFVPRIVGAPGATANWAFGAYMRDRGGGASRAVVLGVMAANLSMINTMTPLTWNLDLPMPYTADRFFVDGGHLRAIPPLFASFDQYTEFFFDPSRWALYRETLARHDPMYRAILMRATWLDHSALARLIRRAYGQRVVRSARANALDQNGFLENSEAVTIARAIVRGFARQAREEGMLPVIYLVNNLSYSDHLFQALRPTLATDNIPCLSSHAIASPADPRLYLSDSHFIDQVDDKLATALVAIVEEGRSGEACTAPPRSSGE